MVRFCIGTSGAGHGRDGRERSFRATLAAVIGHSRRPGRLRGPGVLAALVICSSLIGPSTLQAADPKPSPTPRPATTPTKGHEMFRGQPGTSDVGIQAADAPIPLTLPAG